MSTFPVSIALFLAAVVMPAQDHQHQEAAEYLQGLGFVVALEARADLPYEYGWHTWHAAHAEAVDPVELATFLVTEKSGPDMDFSVVGALNKPYTYKWDPKAEGAAKERGLFQLAPTWARKAGFKRDQLWDPAVNARVAAFVLRKAHESHKKCEHRARKYAKKNGLPYTMLHTYVAHWKCGRDSRDDREGRCYDSQKKLKKTMASMTAIRTPSFTSIGRAYNQWYDGQIKAVKDRMRHRANTRKRRARRAAKKKLDQLQRDIIEMSERATREAN